MKLQLNLIWTTIQITIVWYRTAQQLITIEQKEKLVDDTGSV